MAKIYIQPETVIIEIDNLSLMAAVSGPPINTDPITPGSSDARSFDFFAAPVEEQEESTKVSVTNEEEWDDFEEEE
jgi:hypothetical protein